MIILYDSNKLNHKTKNYNLQKKRIQKQINEHTDVQWQNCRRNFQFVD
jgi:hypothetical protein